jgi:hypothetical protein
MVEFYQYGITMQTKYYGSKRNGLFAKHRTVTAAGSGYVPRDDP